MPFFVGATAGTTVTGAFDPLEPLSKVAPAMLYQMSPLPARMNSPVCHSDDVEVKGPPVKRACQPAWVIS